MVKSAVLRVARRPPPILAIAAIMPSWADMVRPCRAASAMDAWVATTKAG